MKRNLEVFKKALSLFEGDVVSTMDWMTSPVRGLGSRSPVSMLETEKGRKEVENLIGRLEHGVYS